MSGRPLDVLEAAVGDEVEVRLKSGETYRGTLAGYDQHMNLVLDDAAASPGDGTAGVSGNEGAGTSGNEGEGTSGNEGAGTAGTEDASAAGNEEAASSGDGAVATTEEADGPEEAADSTAETPADGRDTTIIRGDNVVSITP